MAKESARNRWHDFLDNLRESTEDFVESFQMAVEMGEVKEIARRLAVTNTFDSILTMLGVLIGSYVSGLKDPRVVINVFLGGAIAIAMSGTLGTYMTERAERLSKVKELETAVLMDLDETIVGKAEKISALLVAIISGLTPSMIVLSLTIPFIIAEVNLISLDLAFMVSVAETLTIMFLIGAYLGKVSRENKLIYGLIYVALGGILLIVMMALGVQ